jgi:hypothetical protein
MTHEANTHVDDLFKYSLSSILLAKHYLKVQSPKNDECSNDHLNMIACLILRHLLQTICNAHAITQLKDDGQDSDQMTYDREQIRYYF